jgi:Tfp pilus assembly protein PilE
MFHFTGTMDNSKLQAAIDAANKNLSADCKLDISADDYKTVSVTYELWRGWSADRLRFSVVDSSSKTNAEFTIDSSAYSKPVTIEAPKDAKDLTQALKDLFASGATDPEPVSTRKNVPADTASAVQKSRDAQRKSDLTRIRNALELYFVDNNVYPSALKQLTVRTENNEPYLTQLPVDPTNKSPYLYTYTPAKASGTTGIQTYTISSCLENAADTGVDVFDPVAPCKTAVYQLTNP